MARIMTVDDSTTMRVVLAQALKVAGHEVIEACEGMEAISLANSQRVNLVITDVNMPRMDGLTLIRELRKLPTYRTTPILVLTTEMDPLKKKQAKESGATGWLVKPFEPQQLLATIRKVLD